MTCRVAGRPSQLPSPRDLPPPLCPEAHLSHSPLWDMLRTAGTWEGGGDSPCAQVGPGGGVGTLGGWAVEAVFEGGACADLCREVGRNPTSPLRVLRHTGSLAITSINHTAGLAVSYGNSSSLLIPRRWGQAVFQATSQWPGKSSGHEHPDLWPSPGHLCPAFQPPCPRVWNVVVRGEGRSTEWDSRGEAEP